MTLDVVRTESNNNSDDVENAENAETRNDNRFY